MALPSVDVSDVLIGPVWVYRAPVAEPLPALTAAGLVNYTDAPGGNWEYMGDTNAPLTLAREREEFEVESEQRGAPIRRMTTADVRIFETSLLEHSLDNIAMAMGGTATTVAATATDGGYEQLAITDALTTLPEYAWLFVGEHVTSAGDSFAAYWYVQRGDAMLNGNLQYGKEQPGAIPLRVRELTPDSGDSIVWRRITAEPTA